MKGHNSVILGMKDEQGTGNVVDTASEREKERDRERERAQAEVREHSMEPSKKLTGQQLT